MADRVYSAAFSLVAVIDGEDALSLDVNPSAVIWNQEGEVTIDANGNPQGNPSWPAMYVTASVKKGESTDTGWLFGYSLEGCSMTLKQGIYSPSSRTFMVSDNGNSFQLSNPRKMTDSNGKEVASLWTNGTLVITATKSGYSQLKKNVPIALNALATWQLSVVNGAMTATSKKTEQTMEDGYVSKTDFESRIAQTENKISTKVSRSDYDSNKKTTDTRISTIEQKADSITLKVTSQRSGRNMWINGDFEMNADVAPKYLHNTDGSTAVNQLEDDVDLPAGFSKRVRFNVPKAEYGIFFPKGSQKYITPDSLNNKNAYCLSFYAKTTKNCDMRVGFEGVSTAKVSLTAGWKRFAVYFPGDQKIDYSKWNGVICFYPTAIGADNYVCITGIQFEVGTEADGAPTVWAKSTFDTLETTGIDIRQGVINAIAGMFNFVGKDGKPYIKLEQDSNGYPHLVFYNPTKTDSTGNPMPAYDLGYTGMKQIIGTGHSQSWTYVRYQKTFAAGESTTARDFYQEMIARSYLEACRYNGGYYYNSAYGKVWLPAEAERYDGLYYEDESHDNDDLPTGSLLEDGWHVYFTGYKTETFNDGIGDVDGKTLTKGYRYVYTYKMFYTKSGKRYTTEYSAQVSYTDSSYVVKGSEYSLYVEGSGSEAGNSDDVINFPSEPTK